ncbi:MAG: polymer-forming cytoskeletal protein [Deltaproteobacteria bacterium]|nr:polymer-forming cytoskeletal protein [Deltaproteobacteria bacterium]
MAFGRRTTDSQPQTSTGADLGALTAFIDQGSSFEGKLSFKDTVRIDGHFAGEISSENTLVVGETGIIEANVRSQIVIISGTVAGDIVAGKKIVMHKTGRVDGNVSTPSLVMEDGAVLNGQLKMSDKKASLTSAASPQPPKPPIG